MMQHAVAFLLPALPLTVSAILMAAAAFLAGALLVGMITAAAVKLVRNGRSDSHVIVRMSNDPERAERRARSVRKRR